MSQMNFDTQEVNKFNSIASEWWDPNGKFKTLHQINPLRLNFIQKNTSLQNKRILDIGCGGGILTEGLAERGAIVTGLDMANDSLDIADAHAKKTNLNINYILSTVEAFAEQTQPSFDIITCMELLEHVPDPRTIISTCAKLTQSNGLIFFSTINRTAKAYLEAIIGAEFLLNLLPRGTHDYAKFIRPSEIMDVSWSEKLHLKDMAGITYNPFTKEYTLTNSVDVNYLICVQKQ